MVPRDSSIDLELRLAQPGQEVPIGGIEGEPNLPENEDRGRGAAAREQRVLERRVNRLEQVLTLFREEADQLLRRVGIPVSDPEDIQRVTERFSTDLDVVKLKRATKHVRRKASIPVPKQPENSSENGRYFLPHECPAAYSN